MSAGEAWSPLSRGPLVRPPHFARIYQGPCGSLPSHSAYFTERFLRARYCAKLCRCMLLIFFLNFLQSCKVGNVIIPILLKKKARPREVPWLISGHTYNVSEYLFKERLLCTTQQLAILGLSARELKTSPQKLGHECSWQHYSFKMAQNGVKQNVRQMMNGQTKCGISIR